IFVLLGVLAAIVLATSSASSSYRNNLTPQAGLPGRLRESAAPTRLKALTGLTKVTSVTNSMLAPAPPVDAPEVISTFAADCTTAKTAFVLGDTVCVQTSGGPDLSAFARRVALVDGNSIVRDTAALTTDPQTTSFTLPNTQTSVVAGQTFDNRGIWR